MTVRTAAAIAVLCAALAAYFAFDAARARRDLSRAAADRDAVLRRETDLSRRVAETSERADRIERELALLRAERDRLSGELQRSEGSRARAATLDLTAERPAKAAPIPSVNTAGPVELIRVLVPAPATGPRESRAAIRSASGAIIWQGSGSRSAGGGPLTLLVPSRLLAPGDYVLTVAGDGGAGDYAFRVHR